MIEVRRAVGSHFPQKTQAVDIPGDGRQGAVHLHYHARPRTGEIVEEKAVCSIHRAHHAEARGIVAIGGRSAGVETLQAAQRVVAEGDVAGPLNGRKVAARIVLVVLAVAARHRMVGGIVGERVGGERNRRGERLERAHRGAVGVGVKRVPVTRHRGTGRPGADDGAQIVRGVVLIDGDGAAGDGDALRPSGGIVAVEREVAQPVRDLAQPVRVIVLVGDGVPSGQRHAGQLAGGVVGISDLVAERIGVANQVVEAVAPATRKIERHLHVARRKPGDAVAGVVAGSEHPAAGIGARDSPRGAIVPIAPTAAEGVYEGDDQAIAVILVAGPVAACIGDARYLPGGGANGGDHAAGGISHAHQVAGRVVFEGPDIAVGIGNVSGKGGGIVRGPAVARAVGDGRQVAAGIVSEADGSAVGVDRADAPAGDVVGVRDGIAGWVGSRKQESGRVGNVEGGIAIAVRHLDLGGVVGNAVPAHGAVGRGDGGH